MTLSTAELILSLPTTVFSIISFFSALYIAISAWLLHKARVQRLKTMLSMQSGTSQGGISHSASYSSHSHHHHHHDVVNHFESSQFNISFYERPELICSHIFWMSICDALFSLFNLFSWFPKLFSISIIDSTSISCQIFGIIEQFIMSSGVAWYLMIAWCLCSILFGINNNDITSNFNKIKKIHHFIVWSVSLICTIIPLYPFNEYGRWTNVERDDVMGNDTECWISNQLYFISFYGLVGISLLFTIFLLIYISIRWNCPILRLCKHKSSKKYRCGIRFICCPQLCVKKNKHKELINDNDNDNDADNINTPQSQSQLSSISSCSSNNNVVQFSSGYIFGGLSLNDGDMISRLELFIIVFIIIWIGPFCVRMYNFICINCIAPIWATAIHHYGISLLGLGNAIVWSQSKNFHSPFNSYKQINKQQQIQNDEEFVGQFNRAISNI